MKIGNITIKRASELRAKIKKAKETGNDVFKSEYFHKTQGIYSTRFLGLVMYRNEELIG